MKRRLFGGMLLALACGTLQAGTNARFEGVLKDLLGTLDKLSGTLTGIRDQETAKAAQPELRKLAGHWQALIRKAEDVAPPNREEKERLEKEYSRKLDDARNKLF